MIDWTAPVVLKGEIREFPEYCATVRAEHQACLEWLGSGEVRWHVPGGLSAKVVEDGSLRPFHGDTVVLPLEEPGLTPMARLQRSLREELGDHLARPLDPGQFHVTVHDLAGGPDREALEERLVVQAKEVRLRFDRIATALDRAPARSRVFLESTGLFPSCNISMVLGLQPATDQDFRALMAIYNLLDEIVPLAWWPRLHVTLDYFRPVPLDAGQVGRLARVIARLAPPRIDLQLDLKKLAYQTFTDMNSYITLFTVAAGSPGSP
ncbi:MAG: hypothetical protein HY815_20205 [Candidatus Riflebacteria bacterium]|nr:hypothetical protein [Candidatus Riflebacteria bacterium]